MIVEARTHHGQFRENVKVFADTEGEFVSQTIASVGYVHDGHADAMSRVWNELVTTGGSYFGWTDFVVVA